MKLSIQVKPKDKDNYYVYICLFHNKGRVLIATPYILSAKHISKGKITNKAVYAEIYNKELLKYQERINQVAAAHLLTANDIKAVITSPTVEQVEAVEFFEFCEEHIAKIAKVEGRERTAEMYGTHLKKLRQFAKREKLYTFEITSQFLEKYIEWMRDKRGNNNTTINISISTLRVLFNACRDYYNDYDLGIINIKNYPFKKVKPLRAVVDAGSRALEVDDLQKIINAEGLSTVLERARDYFLLSFYLLGMNNVDMYYCIKGQYANGRLDYSRRKTQRRMGGSFISIPVSSYAAELIEKYKGEGDALLNFSKKFSDVRLHNQFMHYHLPKLHSKLGLSVNVDKFSWYSARHTWASIAANECHFSDAEVARALNHQSEHKVTRGYIRPDWSLLDRMNEAVLAVVFKEEQE